MWAGTKEVFQCQRESWHKGLARDTLQETVLFSLQLSALFFPSEPFLFSCIALFSMPVIFAEYHFYKVSFSSVY